MAAAVVSIADAGIGSRIDLSGRTKTDRHDPAGICNEEQDRRVGNDGVEGSDEPPFHLQLHE